RNYDYHVGMSEQTVQLLRRYGAKDPVLIKPGTDYRKEVVFGVVGRTYNTGRKNERLVSRMKDAGFKVIAWGEGWPCEIVSNDPAKLPEFYKSIDYLVVTSTNEGGPMPVLEALALGTPVIAPDVGWCWEYPVIRYEKGNWESLRSVLRGLSAPQTWEEWRTAHRELFLKIALERGLIDRNPVNGRLSMRTPGAAQVVVNGAPFPAKPGDSLHTVLERASAELPPGFILES